MSGAVIGLALASTVRPTSVAAVYAQSDGYERASELRDSAA